MDVLVKAGSKAYEVIKCLERAFVGAALLVTILLAVIGVFFRYVLQSPLAWSGEVLLDLFIWITFVGASIAVRKRIHVSIDVLTHRLSPQASAVVNQIARALFALFIALLGWTGFQTVLLQLNSGETSAALTFPMWIISAAIPVGSVLMLLSLLAPPELDEEPVVVV